MNSEAIMERIRRTQNISMEGRVDPSLREIAEELGIPGSTFTRLKAGKSLSAEALLKLLTWLSINGEEPMASIVAAVSAKRVTKRKVTPKREIA